MVHALATWLHGTTLSWAVAGGVPWIWPLCETLHFMGLALLMGTVGVLDLRMLGMAKGLPLGPLQRLMPWLVGVNVMLFYVTGLYRRVDKVAAGHDVPPAAKLVAGVSLLLWIGVMYWG